MVLLIISLRIRVEILEHHLGINDRLAILIRDLGGIDVVVQELRRLDGLLRVLMRLWQILRRIWTVLRRWIVHRPGTQVILIEFFSRSTTVDSVRVFSSSSVVVSGAIFPSASGQGNCRAVRRSSRGAILRRQTWRRSRVRVFKICDSNLSTSRDITILNYSRNKGKKKGRN